MRTGSDSARRRIGVTVGDFRGVGPEITARSLADSGIAASADFVVIGPDGVLAGIAGAEHESVGDARDRSSAAAGRLAGLAIARGVELALDGRIDALVTAPIDKAAFHQGGWHFPGHTEMLQSLTNATEVGMLMAAERTALGAPLRVLLATTHLALRDVPDVLTPDLIERQARLLDDALRRWWEIARPRLALCAFNPHASDGGLFGDEEARVMRPAVEALLKEGVGISDPLPADTVFRRAIGGEFDAVIAPYHDVGMAAFKTVAFGGGVNVTLGLPFPRTSPDHGTALDIAGLGIADHTSMMEAIRLAIRLAGRF